MTFDYALKGKRIKLIHTNDPYTELKSGDMGTIELINRLESEFIEPQIWVKWDNGSDLMLLEGIDKYEVIQ
jgi:hypothetical protein